MPDTGPDRVRRAADAPDWDAVVARLERELRGMPTQQLSATYFTLTRLLFARFAADPEADPRWVAAAERGHGQVGTLLLRAKGYTTEAMALDAAIARTAGGAGRVQ